MSTYLLQLETLCNNPILISFNVLFQNTKPSCQQLPATPDFLQHVSSSYTIHMHRISLRLTNQPPQSSVQFTWPMCINNIFPIEKLASWLQYLNKTLFITTQE